MPTSRPGLAFRPMTLIADVRRSDYLLSDQRGAGKRVLVPLVITMSSKFPQQAAIDANQHSSEMRRDTGI